MDVSASEDGKNYEKLGTLQGRQVAGPQYFSIKPLLPRFMYLQVVIRQTFGANKTYLNQVFLLEETPGDSQLPDSQELKTMLRKQLSHLEENVRNMQSDPPPVPLNFTLPRPKSPVLPPPEDTQLATLQTTINQLTEQVKSLQQQVASQRNIEVLKEVKQQLISELVQKEERFTPIPAQRSPQTQQEFLIHWQENVLEQRLAQFESRILSLLQKPKVEDIMRQIEEKVRLRNHKAAQLEIQQKAGESRYRDSYSSLY